MANFEQAVKWMKEGKIVKRKGSVFELRKEGGNYTTIGQIDLDHLLETDWEIYEEKDDWNLADNVGTGLTGSYTVKQFKTFIQKIEEDIDKIVISKFNTGWEDWRIKVKDTIKKRAGNLD